MEKEKIKHFFLLEILFQCLFFCIQDPVESLPTGELRCIICSVKMNSRECANAHIMGTPAYSTISNLVPVLPVLVPRSTVVVLCTTGTL
jgi:hypothetical protein